MTDSGAGAGEGKRINFLEDDPSEMTLSRKLALFLMKRYKWYNPRLGEVSQIDDSDNKDDPHNNGGVPEGIPGAFRTVDGHPVARTYVESPSLEKAWAYFEHVSLPRYVCKESETGANKGLLGKLCDGNHDLQRAEPGEMDLKTKLYSPIFTPHSQLGDFGLGMGLYFTSVRGVMILAFWAFVLNIPTVLYYSGDLYSAEQTTISDKLLKGSAICTDYSWVPCSDCFGEDRGSFSFPGDRFRYLYTSDRIECFEGYCDAPSDLEGGFARKNNCEGATLITGFINIGTMILVAIGMVVIAITNYKSEVSFDEDEQTASDYSVVIENPPHDASDPEEWKRFIEDAFGSSTHVTCCTIAVDNDLFVRCLKQRRELMKKLEILLEPGTSMDMDTVARVAANIEQSRGFVANLLASVSPGIPEIYVSIAALTARIKGLVQCSYPVTNVFLTFEKEQDQRRVLSTLSTGILSAVRNSKTALPDPKYLFRGERVLLVKEPAEPNTIRWDDLNASYFDRMKQQFFTFLATVAAMSVLAVIVFFIKDDTTGSAYTISIFNVIFPMFGEFLTNMEAHSSEGSRQKSLYWKIALFRWVNTAVVLTIVTPFNVTIDDTDNGVISKVQALFIAEIVTATALQILDISGHVARHFSAPRAPTQDAMNLNMTGTSIQLAERYTGVTKMLFLSVWYSALYPMGLLLCAISMFLNYYVDKFSLMRSWAKAPSMGDEVSKFSRKYFFSMAVFAMAFMSSYFLSGFPYDNLCVKELAMDVRSDGKNNSRMIGTWEVPSVNHTYKTAVITVRPEDYTYEHCFQDFLRTRGRTAFPFWSKNQKDNNIWMTDDQALVTDAYAYVTLVVMAIVLSSFLYLGLYEFIKSLFTSTYSPRGDDMGIDFSDVEVMSSYVPQVSSSVYPYPLLATNIDNIDVQLLDWTDPDRLHSFYDLTKDAKMLVSTDISKNICFSQIYHWPPKSYSPSEKSGETFHSARAFEVDKKIED